MINKKRYIVLLISILSFLLSGCYYYNTEITEIYYVENYKIHDTGVEIWSVSEEGIEHGFFVDFDNVYFTEESSRVIVLYNCYKDAFTYEIIMGDIKETYLYLNLNRGNFDTFIKERYLIEEGKYE